MKLIVIGNATDFQLSTELAYARGQMLRLFPAGARVSEAPDTSLDALAKNAAAAADTAKLDNDDQVLLVRTPFMLWAPNTLTRLADALRQGATAAASFDSRNTNPTQPPDYLTLRGLDRYQEALARATFPEKHCGIAFPAMLLTTARALRNGRWQADMRAVAGAYAHDFSNYHQGSRDDVLPLIPKTARTVLDVGGGEGRFLELTKREIGCTTHLAEFSPAACDAARCRVDRVWQGDFLQTEFDTRFDCITFLDVLEHTTWPEQWLRKASGLLQADGRIVASIPNVGHWSIVADLLEGHWDYAAAGIHCITHLRFFTRRGIELLLDDSGLEIVDLHCHRIDAPGWFDVSSLRGLHVDADNLSTYAFLLVARAKS